MNWRPLTPNACVVPRPSAVSLVTCSYSVIAGTWRIAARARRSKGSPAAGGHGISSDVVPPVQPDAAARIVSRFSPRAQRAGATTQPGPQPRTGSVLEVPGGPASVIETENVVSGAPFC